MTWKEFKAQTLEAWTDFYFRWAYAPAWQWVTQITYLVTLFGGMYLSLAALVEWADTVPKEEVAKGELIFWLWMFGTVAFMFIWRTVYSNIAFYVLHKLNLIDD